jgi:hypothetical protein
VRRPGSTGNMTARESNAHRRASLSHGAGIPPYSGPTNGTMRTFSSWLCWHCSPSLSKYIRTLDAEATRSLIVAMPQKVSTFTLPVSGVDFVEHDLNDVGLRKRDLHALSRSAKSPIQ